jgi:hypothetical protein
MWIRSKENNKRGQGTNSQNSPEKDLGTISYLFESGLANHPFIKRILNSALRTGNFPSLNQYLDKNQGLIEKTLRHSVLQEQLQIQNPFYPFPDGDELEKLSGPINLGIINKKNGVPIPFGVFTETFTMHGLVDGRTGTGKSWGNIPLLGQLVTRSSEFGFNVVVPDVKLFYRRLLGKIQGIKIITFKNFIFNPLEVPEWMDPRDFIILFAKKFAADNILGIVSEGIIRRGLEILFQKKGIFEGRKNHANLKELLAVITTLQNSKFYGSHYRDVFENVTNRLMPYVFLENNFCKRKGICYEVFVKENVILELPLNKVPDSVHNFLVSWIANLNFAKNMTLGLRGNQLRTFFLIDEARTILSASRERSALDWIEPGLNEVIAKGREFGIGLWLCSQEMSSFSQVFRSNCLIKISYPLTDGEDVSEVKKSFGLTHEQTEYLFKLPDQRVAICRFGKFDRPFLLVIPELTGFDRVPNDLEVEQEMEAFYKEIIPKEDSEIIEITDPVTPKFNYTEAQVDGLTMMKHLAKNPFLNYKNLIDELKLTPARGDKARTWMVNSGFVEIHSIKLKPGRPGEYFELKVEAYKSFGGKPPEGKGGFEHKCFCYAIKDFLEEQGFGVRLEGMMDGSSKNFDVLAWKTGEGMFGYEVTLHTHNLIQNLKEDLKTTVRRVVVVSPNKEELQEARAIVRNGMGQQNRLEFKTIFEFTKETKDSG